MGFIDIIFNLLTEIKATLKKIDNSYKIFQSIENYKGSIM